jgi:hypothetical protein
MAHITYYPLPAGSKTISFPGGIVINEMQKTFIKNEVLEELKKDSEFSVCVIRGIILIEANPDIEAGGELENTNIEKDPETGELENINPVPDIEPEQKPTTRRPK